MYQEQLVGSTINPVTVSDWERERDNVHTQKVPTTWTKLSSSFSLHWKICAGRWQHQNKRTTSPFGIDYGMRNFRSANGKDCISTLNQFSAANSKCGTCGPHRITCCLSLFLICWLPVLIDLSYQRGLDMVCHQQTWALDSQSWTRVDISNIVRIEYLDWNWFMACRAIIFPLVLEVGQD